MTTVPLDWALIEFPGNQFKGEIAPEIYRLVEEGLIRVIDVVLVSKDKDGNYTSFELNNLPDEVYQQFMPFDEQLESWFTAEDVESLAERVPNDSAAMLVLWQNIWTENFRRAISNANGRILAHERVPAEVLDEVLAEIEAMKEMEETEETAA
jgi:uncharacterized membrane protein